jgi:secreted PhoX family phosphatase
MKVKGKTTVEVEIDQSEARRITVRTLRDTFGWPDGAYIDVNGNLIVVHDGHTSHSFVNTSHKFTNETEIIRKANEDDFALRNIIHRLSIGRF